MSEALVIWMSAGIVLCIGTINVGLTVYTWVLMKGIRQLLESNIYLNSEAIDLMQYGINRDYELGEKDALKKAAMEDTYEK